ncbi:adipocyte plasma membrane-associated protein Hemomucin-like [Ochlerotatus camptorhynchus]|uniref:adipocyte plasma membrane-associated protein Hemomucin-like n=1 Tax=Ochlerotatus camptorhynchus TaxID=644619 RepID=UPI0031E1CB1A
MGFKSKVFKVSLFVALVAVLPGLPPYPSFPFKAFSVTPPRKLEGILAPNQLLNNPERWLENQLVAPESIVVRGNTTYASMTGGKIVEITSDDQIRVITKFGVECKGTYHERECGRPLGIAFDTQGNNLIVMEPYFGVYQVQIKTGEKKLLIPMDQIIEGGKVSRKPGIPANLEVARNGDIYWSDMSSDFRFEDGMQAMLLNPSGRLLHYSRATGKNRVLIDEVYGATGVALSKDESFALVAELGGQLIRRYYLKGPKAGTDDIFIDGLPGQVDNLVQDDTGLWAALLIAVDESNPSLLAKLAPFPNVRKFLVRLMSIAELPFDYIYQQTGSHLALRVSNFIGNFESLAALYPKRGTVLRLDWEGNILAALHSDDGHTNMIDHAVQSGDYLLLGSPVHNSIRKVKLTEEVLKVVSPPARKVQPKVVVVDSKKEKQAGHEEL